MECSVPGRKLAKRTDHQQTQPFSMSLWGVPRTATYSKSFTKHYGEIKAVHGATKAVVRIAVKKNLPKLLEQRSEIVQPPPKPLTTVAAQLVHVDRRILLDEIVGNLACVLDDCVNWDKHEATASLGIRMMAEVPIIQEMRPGSCWILKNRQQLEEHLPQIIRKCAETAPRLRENLEKLLADHEHYEDDEEWY